MNIHKNARLTLIRRLEMVKDVVERKLTLAAAASVHGVSVPTVRKWVGRRFPRSERQLPLVSTTASEHLCRQQRVDSALSHF